MKTKSILWMAVMVPAALAADKGKDNLHAWYRDGTCLEFYSESTGSTTPSSTSGSVIVDNTNTVRRVVIDSRGEVLFAYDVVARKAAGSKDMFELQIRPAGRKSTGSDPYTIGLGDQLAVSVFRGPAFSGSHIVVRPDGTITVNAIGEVRAEGLSPMQLAAVLREKLKPHVADPDVSVSVMNIGRTLAAVRDFPAVKRGEAVMVDILQNPTTGEKIYDVLRPSDAPPPSAPNAVGDEFVLGDMQISIDGEKIQWATGATLSGAGARIYVPGHGAYYLSVGDAPGFHEAGHANREKLTFQLDHEHVEITLKKNVLSKSAYRVVWVKHDPAFAIGSASGPGGADANAVDVATADNVEWLMPKKR
jgi:hypothetical protein